MRFSKELFWPLLIILFAILIYGHSLSNGFIWDDNYYVWKNSSIHSLSGLKEMWSLPTVAFYDNPLTLTTFWLEHKLWGFNPWGYHCVNLTLHILNALLLFSFLQKLRTPLAGITALLFTIHPIQVETVAWISERKNLLCFFFLMFAAHNLIDIEKENKRENYFKMAFWFALALLSKAAAAYFLAAPSLYFGYKRRSISKRILAPTLPLFLLGIAVSYNTIHVHHLYASFDEIFSWPQKIIFAGKAFFFYIKQVALPVQFLTFYPKWDLTWSDPFNWIPAIGLVMIFGIFYLQRRRLSQTPFILLCWYACAIAPALGLFHITYMHYAYAADHFSYLATPPLLLLFCTILHPLIRKLKSKSKTLMMFAINSLLVFFVVYLSLFSHGLTKNYKDNFSLFGYPLIQENTSSANSTFLKLMRTDNFSSFFISKKGGLSAHYKEILQETENSLIASDQAIFIAYAYQRMGDLYLLNGDFKKALSSYQQAWSYKNHPLYAQELARFPSFGAFNSSEDFRYLGIAYLLNHKPEEAAKAFKHAIDLNSNDEGAHHGLELSLLSTKKQ